MGLKLTNVIHFFFILCILWLSKDVDCQISNDTLLPTVAIAVFVRNKGHTLPYFFGYLERLDYPKDRISLYIRSDHNTDNTLDVLKTWIEHNKDSYNLVDYVLEEEAKEHKDDLFEWSVEHFKHLIKLKEDAMSAARKMWADYVLFIDADVFLVNNNTLKLLMLEEKTVVAPVIETLFAYSNFWCGMTEKGYYKRTDDYLKILEREKTGCFDVPMVHSCVLINLNNKESLSLTFDPQKIDGYSGPIDDIIVFAHSARTTGVKMHVLNKEQFGHMLVPLEKGNTLQDDEEQLLNLKIEIMVDQPQVYISTSLENYVEKVKHDTLGFDQVYLINLKRRSERRVRMLNTLAEIGIFPHMLDAVDGKTLNDTYIQTNGIKMLPEYADPYHKRPLTSGEIGCFLSHYQLWKDMIEKQHRTALVLEDDLRFEPFFRKKVDTLIKEAQKIGLLWDLIYLGRKRLSDNNEPFVPGTTNLVSVDYSYWTLAYLITLEGAKKLVSANPLPKLVPVDEFLPIMFDRHPEEVWKGYYPKRNLKAFSAQPLLVFPTHYTGEDNYISDTEDSEIALSVVRDEL
ncbi:hypothetical protein JTE90_020480 [Oedothorax gibbosus]|uniref:Glycosyl transferase family 25 domain-containing protein n=1 Tax=Oedothorax gibbosus TaxID=931172 RepID=A0AAV6UQQ5_9ARAC|nr:hypothetical protein JTE90_020480 [Oedothorax gibbosus]